MQRLVGIQLLSRVCLQGGAAALPERDGQAAARFGSQGGADAAGGEWHRPGFGPQAALRQSADRSSWRAGRAAS